MDGSGFDLKTLEPKKEETRVSRAQLKIELIDIKLKESMDERIKAILDTKKAEFEKSLSTIHKSIVPGSFYDLSKIQKGVAVINAKNSLNDFYTTHVKIKNDFVSLYDLETAPLRRKDPIPCDPLEVRNFILEMILNLVKYGWCQKKLVSQDRKMCVLGVAYAIASDEPVAQAITSMKWLSGGMISSDPRGKGLLAEAAIAKIVHHLQNPNISGFQKAYYTIPDFNDEAGRTFEEIVTMLKNVADA